MRKKVLFLCTLYMITLCLIMTGCKKDEPEQPAKVQTYHVSIQAGKGDANQQNGPRKALGLDGNTLTASWKTGEQVSVRNVTKSTDLTGYLVAESNGVQTTISGDLTGTINAGDELLLRFLSPDYTNQQGTLAYLELHCDYAEATIHVASVTWGDIQFVESIADFHNRQAIAKFTLMNEAKTAPLAASDLKVEVDNNAYNIHVDPATSEIFVALPGFTDKTIKLTATVGGEKYTYTSPSAKTFENGKYYAITVGMAVKNEVHPFSISEDEKIEFAHGNLQYNPSTNTWRIAREQYDFVGDKYAWYSNGDNEATELGTVYENSIKSNNLKLNGSDEPLWDIVGNDYNGWIDMFGWNTANKPLNSSLYARDYASYQTDFVDWGHNPIYDPKADITYPADTWRTLTLQEYKYLLFERTNASKLVGTASIQDHPNGVVNGILILPDDFVLPDGLSFKGVNQTHTLEDIGRPIYSYKKGSIYMGNVDAGIFSSDDYLFNQNRYTLAQWEQLEDAGAVFLPATGERYMDYDQSPVGAFEYEGAVYTRNATYVFFIGRKAAYWTSTRSGEDGEIPEQNYLREAYIMECSIDDHQFSAGGTMTVVEGQSVRLVRDITE